jgi:hypothetical protein
MKKLLSSVALAAGLTCGAVPASAAIVATLSSAATHYNVGDFITVDLAISGLGTEILSAYDLNLFFGNNVLSAGSVTQFLGQFGGFSNTSTSAAFNADNVEVQLSSRLGGDDLASSQSDDFRFVTYGFQARADGVTWLQFGPDAASERKFVGRNLQSLQVDLNSLCISVGTGTCVQAVPEPASMALVGIALTGLMVPGALRRRRHTAGQP